MEWWNGECERAKGRKHERSKKLKPHYSTTPLLHCSTIGDRREVMEEWNNGRVE